MSALHKAYIAKLEDAGILDQVEEIGLDLFDEYLSKLGEIETSAVAWADGFIETFGEELAAKIASTIPAVKRVLSVARPPEESERQSKSVEEQCAVKLDSIAKFLYKHEFDLDSAFAIITETYNELGTEG